MDPDTPARTPRPRRARDRSHQRLDRSAKIVRAGALVLLLAASLPLLGRYVPRGEPADPRVIVLPVEGLH